MWVCFGSWPLIHTPQHMSVYRSSPTCVLYIVWSMLATQHTKTPTWLLFFNDTLNPLFSLVCSAVSDIKLNTPGKCVVVCNVIPAVCWCVNFLLCVGINLRIQIQNFISLCPNQHIHFWPVSTCTLQRINCVVWWWFQWVILLWDGFIGVSASRSMLISGQ